jgi:CHAD domain-containing protein
MRPHHAADQDEIEWQFDALDLRPVQRWLAQRSEPSPVDGGAGPASAATVHVTASRGRRVVDTYADTDTWALYRSGYTLRLRARAGMVEATLKALGGADEARRRRREITQPVASAHPEELAEMQGPVADRVRAVAGRSTVRPLFEVRTLRTTHQLWMDNREVAELALDQTTIPMPAGRSPARLRRVEVEVRSDPAVVEAFARQLQEACRLQPASLSKFEAGVLAHGIGPPARLPFGPADLNPEGPIGHLAFSVLGRQFSVLLDKEPGTRLGDDPEDLHDMRVATRRLRAALRVFAEYLPVRAAALREELTWVAAALGEVRDLDVQLEQLDAWERELAEADSRALEALRGALEAGRSEARARLLEVLDSPRYSRLARGFEAFLRRGPLRRGPSVRLPALFVGPDLIEDRYRKVRKAGTRARRSSTNENLHRLRIRCKRLRYSLEFLAPLYGEVAEPAIKALVKVQDLLGEHQDAVVAIGRLRALAAEPGLPAETVFVMGRLAERYDARAAMLRRRFVKVFGGLHGGKWQRLRRAMQRERASLPPPAPSVPPHLRAVPASAEPDEPATEAPPVEPTGPDPTGSPVSPIGRRT